MVNQRLIWDKNERKIIFSWDWRRPIRRGRETNALGKLVQLTEGVKLHERADRWRWKNGVEGKFSVGKLRKYIADQKQGDVQESFDWINWVPLKVNCFAWRLKQSRIPVMCKLANRGVNVETKTCQICQQEEEEVDHTFFRCSHAVEVWNWFSSWYGLMQVLPTSFKSMVEEIRKGAGDMKTRKLGLALAYIVLWTIWKTRNGAVFKKKKARSMNTADEIQQMSFNWIKTRARFSWLKWCDWGCKPSISCNM
ncbi:hypothetical protein LXL04_004124 [Taraxacum kok-saghyz]